MKYISIILFILGSALAVWDIAPRLMGRGFVSAPEIAVILLAAGVCHLIWGKPEASQP